MNSGAGVDVLSTSREDAVAEGKAAVELCRHFPVTTSTKQTGALGSSAKSPRLPFATSSWSRSKTAAASFGMSANSVNVSWYRTLTLPLLEGEENIVGVKS